jgi:hypothetical protein
MCNKAAQFLGRLRARAMIESGGVRDRAGISHVGDRDRIALGVSGRIVFLRDRAEIFDVVRRANEAGRDGPARTCFEIVLVGRAGHLAGVVEDRLVLRRDADLLEGRNRHRSQKADDDNDDHDFNEREAFLACVLFHGYNLTAGL